MLDRELHVLAWNHRAEDLWGLRSDEVKVQNFINLDIGLPTERLRQSIRTALSGDGDFSEVQVPATNRRGKSITCKVLATPLLGTSKEIRGVILMLEEQAAAASTTRN